MVDARKAQARAEQRRAAERAILVAAYLEEMRHSCITIICDADGAHISPIASSDSDLGGKADRRARLWCRRAEDAKLVAAAAKAPLRRLKSSENAGSPTAPPVEESSLLSRACDAVLAAACRRNVVLQSDDEITEEASRVVASIDAEIETARRNGELKPINEAYKKYRREAKERGEPAMRYDDWMLKFREDLVRKAAREVRDR
jgi:hypothetical protein